MDEFAELLKRLGGPFNACMYRQECADAIRALELQNAQLLKMNNRQAERIRELRAKTNEART